MRTPGFSRCGIEPLHVAPPREPCEDRKRGRGQARKHGHLDPGSQTTRRLFMPSIPIGQEAQSPARTTPVEWPPRKPQASSSRQGHQAHARVVRVVDPCAPGALHPKRVRKSNRERRYLAFFEIIGQARLSKRLAIRRFGRKLAQTQIRTNGCGIVAARFRE